MANLYCALDAGTVSTCMLCATRDEANGTRALLRRARVTDLGEGVDASGSLLPQAIGRTVACIADYLAQARGLAREQGLSLVSCLTATSAARDASNSRELTARLEELGLKPQVIAGTDEAALGLLGVTGDFMGTTVEVCDIGGGSTELSCGSRDAQGRLVQLGAASLNIGARRVCERFLACPDDEPCDPAAVRRARDFARNVFDAHLSQQANLPETLACVGGTATTLVAVLAELDPYDSDFVHLRQTGRDALHDLTERLLRMSTLERRGLVGLQPKRAHVIHAGALILDELVETGGWPGFVTSESNSLFGVVECMHAQAVGIQPPLSWNPQMLRG